MVIVIQNITYLKYAYKRMRPTPHMLISEFKQFVMHALMLSLVNPCNYTNRCPPYTSSAMMRERGIRRLTKHRSVYLHMLTKVGTIHEQSIHNHSFINEQNESLDISDFTLQVTVLARE